MLALLILYPVQANRRKLAL